MIRDHGCVDLVESIPFDISYVIFGVMIIV